jgi:hypothetical protein
MQMLDEQPHSSNDAGSIPTVISPAATSRQMIPELRDGDPIRRVDAHDSASCPVREVLGGSKVPTSRYPRVATLAQILCEAFELGTEWPATERPDTHRSIEVR